MSARALKCPQCGGPLHLVRLAPSGSQNRTEYRCDCAYCRRSKDTRISPRHELCHPLAIDGFEEVASEFVTIVHH